MPHLSAFTFTRPDKVAVGGSVVCKVGATLLHRPHLLPGHHAGEPLVDGIGSNKNRKGPPSGLEQWIGAGVDRLKGIIDGDGNRPVGDRFPFTQVGNDTLEGPYLIPPLIEMVEVCLKLVESYIGGGVALFTKTVVHEDDRMGGHGIGWSSHRCAQDKKDENHQG